jgi:hypothetical protein
VKIYGDMDLQQNKLKNVALEEVSAFPANPVVGEFCFKDKKVYMCSDIVLGGPLWIPLTNELTTFVHTQSVANDLWSIQHNLGKDVVVQVVDGSGEFLISDVVTVVDANSVTISFANPQAGRAIVVAAANSGGIHTVTAKIHLQPVPSDVWTVNHNLGFKPLVRVVLDDGYEIIPNEVQHVDANQAIIRFTSPRVGEARLI